MSREERRAGKRQRPESCERRSVASVKVSAPDVHSIQYSVFRALDGFCPTPGNSVRAMHNFLPERQVEVLAGFGEARLVRTLDMKYEIHGGSAEDREVAADWIRKFFPDLIWIYGIPRLAASGKSVKKL